MLTGFSIYHEIAVYDATELREVLFELGVVHTLRNLANKELVLPHDSPYFWTRNSAFGVDLSVPRETSTSVSRESFAWYERRRA